MKKQSAPSAVVKFAAARSRVDPLEGTTSDAMADTPKRWTRRGSRPPSSTPDYGAREQLADPPVA
jgi:hypothetical protein